MEPYLYISQHEWDYIKQTFDKDDVKESLAKVAMTYPIPYAEISENDAYVELKRLKGVRHNEVLTDGEWFAREGTEYRYDLTWNGTQQYFRRVNIGNKASNYFQQENRWSVDGSVAPGPKRTWENEKFMTSLMGAASFCLMWKCGSEPRSPPERRHTSLPLAAIPRRIHRISFELRS